MAHRRARPAVLGALVSLLVPLLLVSLGTGTASADGNGKHRHDLDTYKREGWIAVESTAHEHLHCNAGDYAVDGMWKVDAHDGDDRLLRADASYGDDVDVTEWHFRFTNLTPGRAQVKLFVTCLDTDTGERDGHSHALVVGPRLTHTPPVLPGPEDEEFATACGVEQMPVAPGFNYATGHGRVFRSYPTADLRNWYWAFVTDAPAATLTLYQRCLDLTTTSAAGHTHRIDKDFVPNFGGSQRLLGLGIVDESLTARPHDEGLVGAFYIDDPFVVSYLGQDARGQVRTTRFQFAGGGANTVYLGLFGIDKRTTKYPS